MVYKSLIVILSLDTKIQSLAPFLPRKFIYFWLLPCDIDSSFSFLARSQIS